MVSIWPQGTSQEVRKFKSTFELAMAWYRKLQDNLHYNWEYSKRMSSMIQSRSWWELLGSVCMHRSGRKFEIVLKWTEPNFWAYNWSPAACVYLSVFRRWPRTSPRLAGSPLHESSSSPRSRPSWNRPTASYESSFEVKFESGVCVWERERQIQRDVVCVWGGGREREQERDEAIEREREQERDKAIERERASKWNRCSVTVKNQQLIHITVKNQQLIHIEL